jgi:hypothetical protein
MASRLLTLDASRGTVLACCACGFRCVRGTREAARAEFDRHREAVHPVQAAKVADKRRARVRA